MITVEAVQHCLEEKVILAGLSCDLVEARIGIIGANGSGKSSFARLLNGLVIPVTGRVIAHGHDTSREGRAVRRKVGFVFQNPDHQIVYPIVEEDLAFGLKNTGLRGSDLTQRIGGKPSTVSASNLCAIRQPMLSAAGRNSFWPLQA